MNAATNNIPKTVFIGVQGIPCNNFCGHCWVEGNSHKEMPSFSRMCFILDKLAELKKTIPNIWVFFYDEPTNHPQFLEIFEKAASMQLINEGYFLATNGSRLSKLPAEDWSRLKKCGVNSLQLSFYGLENTHDDFAGRRGAFQGIIDTITISVEHQIDWVAQVFLHPDNIEEIDQLMAQLTRLFPGSEKKLGFFPFLWQGRGRKAPRLRSTHRLLFSDFLKSHWNPMFMEEKQAIAKILDNPELAKKKPANKACSIVSFQLDPHLRLYCGGSCDSGGILASEPRLKEYFYLGKLTDDGFTPLIEQYLAYPPQPVQLLNNISWSDLAKNFGNVNNDEIYFLHELPENKWASAYLASKVIETNSISI